MKWYIWLLVIVCGISAISNVVGAVGGLINLRPQTVKAKDGRSLDVGSWPLAITAFVVPLLSTVGSLLLTVSIVRAARRR